jgi:hypothetical protein
MPAIEEHPSELLKDGYHHLRHPEEYQLPFEAPAFEARLRAPRTKKSSAPLLEGILAGHEGSVEAGGRGMGGRKS